MAPGSIQPAGRDIRALHHTLAEAQDGQIARVVAVVDALPERGNADDLIAPLRLRLGRLRPARPLRFARLLFSPLDPLIVPPPRWRPGLPTLPRSVVPPLARTVHAALGEAVLPIERAIAHRTTQDVTVMAEAGAALWPAAAKLLAATPEPIGWSDTGLNEALYPRLARRIGAVLGEIGPLHEMLAEAETGIVPLQPGPLREMLRRVATACPDALDMMLALILTRLPQACALLPAIAKGLGPRLEAVLQPAVMQAVEALLQRLDAATGTEAAVVNVELAETAGEVHRITTLLHELESWHASREHADRLAAIRRRLDASCRARFAEALSEELLGPLCTMTEAADAATVERLEGTARSLRELESEARAVGGADAYDTLLARAADIVNRPAIGLGVTDRVRLVEILSGPELALALLRRE